MGEKLLSSRARLQAPWVKVTIGDYTFGVFSSKGGNAGRTSNGAASAFRVQYPNFVRSLQVIKINGQVNQYTLSISYPVTQNDDPNFFEKVFSSVQMTRKIVFTYGDATMPSYVYKDEEAIITSISQTFALQSSVINYTVQAVSGAKLALSGNHNFIYQGLNKPSSIIKSIYKQPQYGLQNIFKGMNMNNLDSLVAGDDKEVELTPKLNTSPLEYINYLASCMIPASSTRNSTSQDVYIMTIHDDTIYDKLYNVEGADGPYFKVSKVSNHVERSDAYEVDIGFNTSTIVTSFQIENNNNYSILYDYQQSLNQNEYVRRLNGNGQLEEIWAPNITSGNDQFKTRAEDVTWWTKITKYPVNASITIQGLLRPAQLMTYLRLNTIFPGGHKHISSGLYIITKQVDIIDSNGYKTTLDLVKIDGD